VLKNALRYKESESGGTDPGLFTKEKALVKPFNPQIMFNESNSDVFHRVLLLTK
jgi:hypothetical protein